MEDLESMYGTGWIDGLYAILCGGMGLLILLGHKSMVKIGSDIKVKTSGARDQWSRY